MLLLAPSLMSAMQSCISRRMASEKPFKDFFILPICIRESLIRH